MAYSVFGVDFATLFFAPLPNTQSAPFLFLLLSKFIGAIGDYNEYSLYFLPFICGIATLILGLKIAQILFNKNSFGFAVFITLICGSLGLLHYTTEFKQYGVEAFVGFVLFYLFLKQIAFYKFIAISIICVLLSHTGIFVALGIIVGYIKFAPLKNFIANNRSVFIFSAILVAIFLLYYFIYIRFQAVSNFYDYWKPWFIPLDFTKLPAFFMKILSVWSGFTPFDKGFVIPIYMIISTFGLIALYRRWRDIFRICIFTLGIYVGLSVAQIYPFGHEGIIGGRLSLFMSVFFCVMCTFGAEFLYLRFSNKWWRFCVNFMLILLIALSFYRNAQIPLNSRHHIQQTYSFITQISREFAESAKFAESSTKKCVFIYEASKHAFLYYSHIDKTNVPFVSFGADLANLKKQIKDAKCANAWVLASHYPSGDFDLQLERVLKNFNQNATIERSKTGWGAILGRF